MKVLIDFSQIPVQKMGVGVYAFNLIFNLKPEHSVNYYVLVQDDDSSLDKCESDGITLIKINSKKYRKLIYRFLFEQFYLPYLAYKYKIDVIHSLHYSFPVMAKARKIVTVCDMIFYKYPELHLKSKILYFRFFIWLTTLFADKVICISKSTQQDYLSHFKTSSKLTTVIELGKDQSYRPDIDREELNLVLNKYGIDGDFILFIGTIEPRKNISNLILAYARLVAEGFRYRLVIVGKKGWHYDALFTLINELKLNDNIIFTGFIEETEKPYFLSGASVFVYPSLYEGFGIPVLESLACGTPTVTSNISSMPEVAGNAALLVTPESPDEIYNAIKKILLEPNLRSELRARSLRQASNFTWEKTASKTICVYKGVLQDA
jgi:glycosyltransferase involved in cell wall biosynthesis